MNRQLELSGNKLLFVDSKTSVRLLELFKEFLIVNFFSLPPFSHSADNIP